MQLQPRRDKNTIVAEGADIGVWKNTIAGYARNCNCTKNNAVAVKDMQLQSRKTCSRKPIAKKKNLVSVVYESIATPVMQSP